MRQPSPNTHIYYRVTHANDILRYAMDLLLNGAIQYYVVGCQQTLVEHYVKKGSNTSHIPLEGGYLLHR